MARKNLQHIQLKSVPEKNIPVQDPVLPYETAEGIILKKNYTKEDIEGTEHLNFAAGIPPFLRGPYTTMYVSRPWTIRQYA